MKFINDNRICCDCCESTKYVKRTCTNSISCSECGSDSHPGAFHIYRSNNSNDSIDQKYNEHDEEISPVNGGEEKVDTKCTEICDTSFHSS